MSTATTDTQSLVTTLSERGPKWLSEVRKAAWETCKSMQLPGSRDEHWRFTDQSLIDPSNYQPLSPDAPKPVASAPPEASAALALSGLDPAGRAVHADSSLIEATLSEEAKAAGVVYMPLEQAATDHEDIVKATLGKLVGADDLYTAWTLACWQGGMFLYVPDGVQLAEPIQALHWTATSGSILAPRTLVVVGTNAKVVFNDLYAGPKLDTPTLAMPTVEVFVGAGAQVGWVTWQDWGRGVRHHAHVSAKLERDAVLNTLLVTLGGDFSRTTKTCEMGGTGASSYMYGLYFPHADQRFEHWTLQDHAQGQTTSDLLYKGALSDESQSVYYGTIRVRPGAAKTNAYQANRNLTLSPNARAMSNPQLEIENNDVRCTHGATVGRINEDHLFYIQSRGVPREEAERLVVFGFFNEVLQRVEWSGMHERLAEAIRAKMFASGTAV